MLPSTHSGLTADGCRLNTNTDYRPLNGRLRVTDRAADAIEHYHATHDIRFILCDDNGVELCEVPRDRVVSIANGCSRNGRGYVKQVATPKVVP